MNNFSVTSGHSNHFQCIIHTSCVATKSSLRGFRPGPTQIGLYRHKSRLKHWNSRFKKKRNCTIRVAKTKVLICAFVFAEAKIWFSHGAAHTLGSKGVRVRHYITRPWCYLICDFMDMLTRCLCFFVLSLFVLRHHIQVNNFSVMSGQIFALRFNVQINKLLVMSGQSHRFPFINQNCACSRTQHCGK